MKGVFSAPRSGFPDWSETIEDLFMGMQPTGSEVTVAGIDIVRLAGDRIAEHWAVIDQFGMLQQLGLTREAA